MAAGAIGRPRVPVVSLGCSTAHLEVWVHRLLPSDLGILGLSGGVLFHWVQWLITGADCYYLEFIIIRESN